MDYFYKKIINFLSRFNQFILYKIVKLKFSILIIQINKNLEKAKLRNMKRKKMINLKMNSNQFTKKMDNLKIK